MSRERDRQLLNDCLDGSLSADEQEALLTRLRQDPVLSQELAQLRALLARATELPVEVAPERDLWPEIADAIATVTARSERDDVSRAHPESQPEDQITTGRIGWITSTRIRVARQWRPVLAAAAVLTLILLAPHLNREMSRSPDRALGPAWQEFDLQAGGAETILDALALECTPRLEPEVSHLVAREELGSQSSRGVATQSGMLAHNLRIVDLALADLSTAWLANPHDPHLTSLLTKTYRARVNLQSLAVELAAQI
jgi:hypothetical protein